MILYLNAKSENGVTYTPDWLQVHFEEDSKEYDLTFDIQGDIDYKLGGLACRCKGNLIPFAMWLENSEIDYSEMSNEESESLLPATKIAEIINKATSFTVGVYSVNDTSDLERLTHTDTLSECKGELAMYVDENMTLEKKFTFDTEYSL